MTDTIPNGATRSMLRVECNRSCEGWFRAEASCAPCLEQWRQDQRRQQALDALNAVKAALTEIAAFNDERASHHLSLTGSYSRFDEPGAVQAARATLTRIKEILK